MKIPIEIGIPAHNEEGNIAELLHSLMEQEQDIYEIKRIIVNSDASTDATIAKARATGIKVLDLIDNPDRGGKATRVTELLRSAQTDIMVLFDADVRPAHRETVHALVAPLINDGATLTSGRPRKVTTDSNFDRTMAVSLSLQDYVKSHINEGQNIYACHGRIMALHRKLFEKIVPLQSWTGDDAYIYLFNKKVGGKFAYSPEAEVLFKMPQSPEDFIRQQSRVRTGKQELTKLFGDEILSEFEIPLSVTGGATIHAFMERPVSFMEYVGLRFKGRRGYKPVDKAWDGPQTTKKF
jgi:cellulose synthase/poly-beta-1,6-N-acetylglucosamine synthase-like glycosyltransferase